MTATVDFLGKLLAIEDAWALLDGEPAFDRIEAAIALGGHSSQLLIRAAAALDALGDPKAARHALEMGLALDGPTAPLQVALARQLRMMGDFESAARSLRGAMLRARPDAAMLATLAAVELAAGHPGRAAAILAVAGRFPIRNAPGLVAEGRHLHDLGRPDLAVTPFALAFAGGYRDPDFVADLGALLDSGEFPGIDADLRRRAGAQAAQLKLLHACPVLPVVETARLREQSSDWLGVDELAVFLKAAIKRRKPFSWIRLGDGEGRFLLLDHPELRGPLTDREVSLIGGTAWGNWFGQDLNDVDPADISALSAGLDAAIANADLLGLTTSARLGGEEEHRGVLAALNRHLAALAPPGRPSDAYACLTLNERDPFYASLLGGLDFLGVVSPHADLAKLLGARLGITRVASWLIPGETRLGRAQEATDRGSHFPATFEQIMADLTVPRRGAVFLVAGGLLGKLYCDRIKQLGGIALDVGSVVDAWMGYNSRGVVLDLSMRNRLLP